MSNIKAQITNKIQMTKGVFDIWSFDIDLTFELWHLKFQIFEGELHAQKD
jgi:hypothetical protein